MSESTPTGGPILFYDGDCGLCARAVRWVAERDRAGRFRFAPLQGLTYRAIAARSPGAPTPTEAPSSMVVFDDGRIHIESDAALVVAARLGGAWGGLGRVARWCPRPLRDGAYRFIARRRHRWFRRADACAMARPGWADRFLP